MNRNAHAQGAEKRRYPYETEDARKDLECHEENCTLKRPGASQKSLQGLHARNAPPRERIPAAPRTGDGTWSSGRPPLHPRTPRLRIRSPPLRTASAVPRLGPARCA